MLEIIFKAKLKSPIKLRSLYVAAAIVLLVISCRAQSKVVVAPTNTPALMKAASKIKFTSVHTKLNEKTCQSFREPKSDEDEVPLTCTGYKDYKIFVSTHNVASFYVGREISKDVDSWTNVELPSFVLNAGLNQVIEWRLADGEPFACIVRTEYDERILDPDAKGTINEIVVQNLRGFAPIRFSIDAKKSKCANKEARRRADAGYGKL